jgi:hypothetical protein
MIIPYLERLLTEHRQLVLFDDNGVAAFRHLLATFAPAGNQAALTLAYTFVDERVEQRLGRGTRPGVRERNVARPRSSYSVGE